MTVFKVLNRICVIGGLALLSACQMTGGEFATRASNEISLPKYFFTDELSPRWCSRDIHGRQLNRTAALRDFNELERNSQSFTTRLMVSVNANSASFEHDHITRRLDHLLHAASAAASTDDQALAGNLVAVMVRMAANQRYLFEDGLLTRAQADAQGPCYAGNNDITAACAVHGPEYVAQVHAVLYVVGVLLLDYMTPEERQVIDRYFTQSYNRFVRDFATNTRGPGIYSYAGHGTSRLAYAVWKGDARLAAREISDRRRMFLRLIESNGLIDNNSYRGVRGFWYHTQGANHILSYALVARSMGVDFFADPSLGPRLRNLVAQTNRGIVDYEGFKSIGTRGANAILEPSLEIRHVHPNANNLYLIAQKEYGVQLPRQQAHFSEAHGTRIDVSSAGFSAGCYYGADQPY